MFIQHVAEHIGKIGKQLVAVWASVGDCGVKI